MKNKLLIAGLLLFGSVTGYTQTTNPTWPSGKYRLVISAKQDDKGEINPASINLSLYPNGNFTFTIFDKSYETEEHGLKKVELSGTYQSFTQDSVHFNYTDPLPSELQLSYNTGKIADKQSMPVVINLSDRISDGNILLYAGNSFDSTQLKALSEMTTTGSSNDGQQITLNRADSLYIQIDHYDELIRYAYVIPKNATSFDLKMDESASIYKDLENLKGFKGTSANEMYLLIQDRNIIAVYYVGPVSENEKTVAANAAQKNTLLKPANKHSFSIHDASDVVADSAISVTSYEHTKSSDTVHYYTSWKEATEKAKREGKFLVLYNEPKKCKSCSATFNETLAGVNDDYDNYQDSFNKHFVLYLAKDTARYLFRQYGVTQFPATLVLNTEMKPLYIANYVDLYTQKSLFFGYYYNDFYNKLTTSEQKTKLAAQIEKQNYPRPEIEQYLQLQKKASQTVGYDNNELPEDKNSAYTFFPGASYDTNRINKYWDILKTKYHVLDKADTTIANLLLDYSFNNSIYGQGVLIPKVNAANDTTWQTSDDFNYFTRFYNELAVQMSPANTEDGEGTTSLYETLSKAVQNMYRYIDAKPKDLKAALTAHKQLTKASDDVQQMESPVYISYLMSFADTTNMQDELIKASVAFCDQFTVNDPRTTVKNIVATLSKRSPAAMAYAVSNNARYTINENEIPDAPADQYAATTANILNTCAWRAYTSKQTGETAGKAMKWSIASLAFEPENPYYLDTYAHFLYQDGKKKEAIAKQQEAISSALNKKGKYYVNEEELQKMKEEMQKMKTGKL